MAERMSQALSQSPIRDVAQGAEAALAGEQPFKPAVEESQPQKKGDTLETAKPPELAKQVKTPPLGTRWVASKPAQPAAPPITPAAETTTIPRIITHPPHPSAPPPASPPAPAPPS